VSLKPFLSILPTYGEWVIGVALSRMTELQHNLYTVD
jgi:hypothetical protein